MEVSVAVLKWNAVRNDYKLVVRELYGPGRECCRSKQSIWVHRKNEKKHIMAYMKYKLIFHIENKTFDDSNPHQIDIVLEKMPTSHLHNLVRLRLA